MEQLLVTLLTWLGERHPGGKKKKKTVARRR
jgi:hypothetical protein